MAKAKRKSRARWLTIELPSNGINYERFGDREAEQHVEYVAGHDDYKYDRTDMQFEKNHHKWLRLGPETIQTILWDCTEWGEIRDKMYEYHTKTFDSLASEDLGFELELKHVGNDTAEIRLSVARRLLRMMRRDNREAFKEVFEEEDNHWPRRESDELTQHPLTSWSSKEIGWLLRAALAIGKEVPLKLSRLEVFARQAAKMPTTQFVPPRIEREFDSDVYMGMCEGDGEDRAWSEAVDWKKYEAKIQEARQNLFDKLNEEDRQWLIDHGHWDGVLSWNAPCPLTPDMFQPSQTL
jgi:hypothetical protein